MSKPSEEGPKDAAELAPHVVEGGKKFIHRQPGTEGDPFPPPSLEAGAGSKRAKLSRWIMCPAPAATGGYRSLVGCSDYDFGFSAEEGECDAIWNGQTATQ